MYRPPLFEAVRYARVFSGSERSGVCISTLRPAHCRGSDLTEAWATTRGRGEVHGPRPPLTSAAPLQARSGRADVPPLLPCPRGPRPRLPQRGDPMPTVLSTPHRSRRPSRCSRSCMTKWRSSPRRRRPGQVRTARSGRTLCTATGPATNALSLRSGSTLLGQASSTSSQPRRPRAKSSSAASCEASMVLEQTGRPT